MTHLISFFVRRPVTTAMLIAILLFLGSLSLFNLPVDLFPNIANPQLTVVTAYENASAEEVEKNITKPLEEELSFLKNLYYLSSTSEEGISRILLTFRWNTKMDFAALETREKIDLVKSILPENSKDPKIERHNPNSSPIVILSMTQETAADNLREVAKKQIKPNFERIVGVAQVKIFGGYEQEIEVALNQNGLSSYGLSTKDILNALKQAQVTSKGGTVREGKLDLLIKTTSPFHSIEDISKTIIKYKNQKPIYLRNLATIRRINKTTKDHAYLNGKPSVSIAIFKEPSGNTLTISSLVHEQLKTLESKTGATLVSTYDQSSTIEDSISLVKGNAILGAILTIIVLLIFLRSFSTTLIVVCAIPFSILSALSLFYLNNMSLNIFSLAGIALALGMAVDASIVILENIFVHLKQQASPKSAATHATVEVSGAVIASTLTTLAVFIPILFVQGPIGIIFKDLSLAIIFGLFFAMIISFSFIPMISSKMLSEIKEEDIEKKINRYKDFVLYGLKILDQVNRLGTKLALIYTRILERFTITPKQVYEKALKSTKQGEQTIASLQSKVQAGFERTLKEAVQSWQSRVSIIVTVFGLFFIALFFLPDSEFFPQSEQNFYEIKINFPRGTSLEHTEAKSKQIENYLHSLAAIETTQLNVEASRAALLLKVRSAKKASKTIQTISTYLQRQPDTSFSLSALSPLSQITSGLESRALDLKIKGPNFKVLKAQSDILMQTLNKMKGISSTHSSYEASKPEMTVRIDRQRSADFSLTAKGIANSLKEQLYGVTATQLTEDGNETDVVVRNKHVKINTLKELGELQIASPVGRHIALSSIASFEETFAPSTFNREEKQRTLTVYASLNSNTSPDDVIENLPHLSLPSGYSFHVGPNVKLYQESFISLKTALIISIILIYLIMAAQFESLSHPFTILFSVPLSLIGISAALVLTGKLLSISAFIGIIILVGISVNNAIILIDYINILRRRGIDREEAILTAGKRRLRPILMTSITTTIGMLPLALGIGAGTQLYQPLAIVMVGGMISSTLLTLLFIPTIYCFFDDISDIIGFVLLKLQVSLTTRNMKMGVFLLCFLLASCASKPEVTPEKPTAESYEEVWQAAYAVAIQHPLKDFSRSDGTLESNWVQTDEVSRFKFYITLNTSSDVTQATIDIQNQSRKSKYTSWQWVSPALEEKEKLKHAIRKQLKSNRSS